MDYPQHEKTYALFLNMTKWGIIVVVAILLGMTTGLLSTGGFLGGIATFIAVLAVAYFLAGRRG